MYYLKYKEQELPIIIDYGVAGRVTNKLGIKFPEFERTIESFDQTNVVALEALKRGHKLEGKEFNLTPEDVEEILCECYGDYTAIFTACVLDIYIPKDDSKKKFLEQFIQLPQQKLN